MHAIAQIAAANSLSTAAQHSYRIEQAVDHKIVNEQHDAGQREADIEYGEISGVALTRALIEIEVVAVAAHDDHVFIAARANLGVVAQRANEG